MISNYTNILSLSFRCLLKHTSLPFKIHLIQINKHQVPKFKTISIAIIFPFTMIANMKWVRLFFGQKTKTVVTKVGTWDYKLNYLEQLPFRKFQFSLLQHSSIMQFNHGPSQNGHYSRVVFTLLLPYSFASYSLTSFLNLTKYFFECKQSLLRFEHEWSVKWNVYPYCAANKFGRFGMDCGSTGYSRIWILLLFSISVHSRPMTKKTLHK